MAQDYRPKDVNYGYDNETEMAPREGRLDHNGWDRDDSTQPMPQRFAGDVNSAANARDRESGLHDQFDMLEKILHAARSEADQIAASLLRPGPEKPQDHQPRGEDTCSPTIAMPIDSRLRELRSVAGGLAARLASIRERL